MSALQHKRLAALEKATPATMEPIIITRRIIGKNGSVIRESRRTTPVAYPVALRR